MTVVGEFRRELATADQELEGRRWPSPVWQRDPVGFARLILGVKLWKFQTDFLEAIRDHRHVAVSGGRKIGKDFAVAVAAIWWFASFAAARVFLLAPTTKQLDGILYREVRMLWAGAGRCVDCKAKDPEGPRPCPHSALLAGDVGQLARTGIKAADFREILGATAVSEGGLRGFSGGRILAIEDEASDIKDEFDTALVGNLAGADCHRVLISNPTRVTGFFFRAFHEEKHLYRTLTQSTEQNPNVLEGREVFRGLGGREWLEEREKAWGRGSPQWLANVEGKFVKAEKGQLFSLEMIGAAEKRWEHTQADGRLHLGIDVAGETQDGDETVFAPRRGLKLLELVARRGLSPDGILKEGRAILARHRLPEDQGEAAPVVVIDRDGAVGARCYDVWNAYRLRNDETVQEYFLIGFRGGAPPVGKLGEAFRWNRDALFGGLVEWFRDGGAIVTDAKLEGELSALRWIEENRGKTSLSKKTDLRDRLGRSPDRLDALALSTWQARRPVTTADDGAGAHAPAPTLDLQAANEIWYGDAPATDGDDGPWWPSS